MIHRHRGALGFNVLFSSLVLFCFRILVFHLKQKHEEGQRVLHYLQQTNTSLAMCKCVFVRNKETFQN
jgi:branched-subunit amino acid transport protein